MPRAALSQPVTGGGAPAIGIYGKLPARGDFVRAGLPRRFTDPWDAWLQASLHGGRTRLEEAFLPAWMEAPVWRFALAGGLCGPDPAIGLWMPSTDRAGRHFPLTILRVGPGAAIAAGAQAFLDIAEQAGLAAIAEDLEPDAVIAALHAPLAAAEIDLHPPATGSLWWTAGAPRRAAGALQLPGLPEAGTFATMLDEQAA